MFAVTVRLRQIHSSVLDWIAHGIVTGSEDAAEALGYAGIAVFAVGNAPIDFGTDLATGIALGQGMLSTGSDHDLSSVMIGATGGASVAYFTYVGLDALATRSLTQRSASLSPA